MSSSDGSFLGAAAAIGRRLVDEAVWHDGRCSWMGAVENVLEPWRSKYRALGPTLYDGTAGVGLFLAQLAALTGDAAARRTAVGAVRHAATFRSPAADGFHAGALGVAWAAERAAALLDDEQLRAAAPRAANPVSGPDRCPDVITGSAGAILALLALGEPERAAATGEDLLARAVVTRHGWSWALPDRPHRRPLCGLSHGAAGIGWALLELYAATEDERFREGAEGAFAYERSWLDAESGTWPDLRIGGQRRGELPRLASPAVGTWCHGEAGIALARLRAMEILGPEPWRREAEIALEATRRVLAAALRHEMDDLTLCHGAAGAADALLCGAAALGGRSSEAAELGSTALERYTESGRDWPRGVAGVTTPSLFRGLSGVGWWLLRLHEATVPSPLMVPMRLTAVTQPA